MPQYLLGIDNGGTVAKAGLFTTGGEEVAVASRKTEMLTPRPGRTERDAENLWQATAEAIRAVIEDSKVDPAAIACVACAGHGNGLYLVDKQGTPVYNGIISTDTRAKDYIARWLEDGVDRRVLPKTMQCLWAAQPNALLAWIRDNEPEVMKKAGWAMMCKDYIRFRLNGEIHAELTDYSGTSLMNVGTGEYDHEVLEAFGIAEMRDLLPPIVRSEEVCGRVTPAAAAETGLAEGTPVAGGLFDIDACGLASGLTDETQMCMVAGTWSCNQYISREPVISDQIFMTSRYCIPDHFLMLEASPTSASNLEWFITQFFEADKVAARQQGRSVYDLVNELVGGTKPDESKIVFLPFLFGSNADPDAKACFVGMGSWHGRAHVLRAIFEGVVFGHKAHVERLMQSKGLSGPILLTGGAARSDVWVQMFADVFQTPVEIPAGTELGALGAAICAGVAAGVFPNYQDACKAMVKISRSQEPNLANKDVYATKYERYQKVLASLGPVWKEF